MTSDYADNWDALPPAVQEALAPIAACFDAAADFLFDRRLNLSFEAAVKDLSIPGIALLTDALRTLGILLQTRIAIIDAREGKLLFDGIYPVTAYDLPIYRPCLYISQLAQAMQEEHVRVWKDATAREIVCVLLGMARVTRPDIEIARVCIAALHDMVHLHPVTRDILEQAAQEPVPDPNAAQCAKIALQLVSRL